MLHKCNTDCACLEGAPGLYEPRLWKPSDAIGIDRFRQIFLLPLAFHRDEFETTDEVQPLIARVIDALNRKGNGWEAVPDLSQHCDPMAEAHLKAGTRDAAEKAMGYGEQVYFHDFLRETFFSSDPKGEREEIYLFRRKGKHRLSFEIRHWGGGFQAEADLDRINLYVFSSGAAVLALEADFGVSPKVSRFGAQNSKNDTKKAEMPDPAMTLADALYITDHLRRTYSPYFNVEAADAKTEAGLTPARIPFEIKISKVDADGKASPLSLPHGWIPEDIGDFAVADHNLRTRKRGAPPIFEHIRAVLAPLRVAGTPEADDAGDDLAPVMRQVVDERMPLMTFITFKEVPSAAAGKWNEAQSAMMQVSRGDWMRLCYADEPGQDALPYSAHFMKSFEEECCYDRYFPHPSSSTSTSRIMTCGYHFVVAGSGGYSNEELQHHFRRHYFQIGLACHMEIAAMLATSSRVTQAVKKLNDENDTQAARQNFETSMQAIERDFLKYVHLFHFTGMSNQIQPTEMLDKWQARLGTKEMFEDLRTEINTANQFLVAVDQAQDSDASMRLNIVATIGLVLGLAIAFLSMNILGAAPETGAGGTDVTRLPLADPQHWRIFGKTVALFSFTGLVMSILIDRDWWKPYAKAKEMVAGALFSLGCGLVVCGVVVSIIMPTLKQISLPITLAGLAIAGFVFTLAGHRARRAMYGSARAATTGTTGTTRCLLAALTAAGIATGSLWSASIAGLF